MSRQYPKNDPSAQFEKRLADWLYSIDIPETVGNLGHLSQMEAEFFARRIIGGGWVTMPGQAFR